MTATPEAPARRHWFWTEIIFGLFYVAIGIIASALAGAAGSPQLRVVWRFAAYVMSAIALGVNIRHEYVTLRSAPMTTALRAATGVALGGFFLERHAFAPRGLALPDARARFVAAVLVRSGQPRYPVAP